MMIIAAALMLAPLPDSQLETDLNGKEVFPIAFHGIWVQSLADCDADFPLSTMRITDTRLYGYEWDSVLINSTPVIRVGGTRAKTNYTIVALTANRAETDVGIVKVRISLVENQLYMSNPDAVSDKEHLTAPYAYVRCAEPG